MKRAASRVERLKKQIKGEWIESNEEINEARVCEEVLLTWIWQGQERVAEESKRQPIQVAMVSFLSSIAIAAACSSSHRPKRKHTHDGLDFGVSLFHITISLISLSLWAASVSVPNTSTLIESHWSFSFSFWEKIYKQNLNQKNNIK